jgi:hypothetical protein
MERLKRICFSLLGAIIVSALQLMAASQFSTKVLWQATLMHRFVGKGPILGYDSQGQPMYEGTPVHLISAITGLLIGLIVYWIIFYWIIGKIRHNNAMQRIADKPGSR